MDGEGGAGHLTSMSGHVVARQPHVLARRAHRKEGRAAGLPFVLAHRALRIY